MTYTKFDATRLDQVLRAFDDMPDGRLSTDALLKEEDAPDGWIQAVRFLTEEGLIKQFGHYFEITYKGQMKIHKGGFVKEYRVERVLRYSAIIAAICSFLALLVSVIALVR